MSNHKKSEEKKVRKIQIPKNFALDRNRQKEKQDKTKDTKKEEK